MVLLRLLACSTRGQASGHDGHGHVLLDPPLSACHAFLHACLGPQAWLVSHHARALEQQRVQVHEQVVVGLELADLEVHCDTERSE